MDKKEIKDLIQKIQDKWNKIVDTKYLCYDVYELSSQVCYDLFEKDIFNDVASYCRFEKVHEINSSTKEIGQNFICLIEIENNIFFKFTISIRYGVDIPYRVGMGQIKRYDTIPKIYKPFWQMYDNYCIENGID